MMLSLKAYHYQGQIFLLENRYYRIDQLDATVDTCNLRYISSTTFRKYIFLKYHITLAQYYNIVVHDDINKKHYCIICNTELTFSSLFRGFNKLCSNRACTIKHQHTLEEWSNNHKIKMSKYLTNKHKEQDFANNHKNRTRQQFIELHANKGFKNNLDKISWLSRCKNGQYTHGHFYIITDTLYKTNCFKIGITVDLKTRWNFSNDNIIIVYTYYHDIETISELEKQIKDSFENENEWFNLTDLNDIQLYIEKYETEQIKPIK